jgi:hypothetical protein
VRIGADGDWEGVSVGYTYRKKESLPLTWNGDVLLGLSQIDRRRDPFLAFTASTISHVRPFSLLFLVIPKALGKSRCSTSRPSL